MSTSQLSHAKAPSRCSVLSAARLPTAAAAYATFDSAPKLLLPQLPAATMASAPAAGERGALSGLEWLSKRTFSALYPLRSPGPLDEKTTRLDGTKTGTWAEAAASAHGIRCNSHTSQHSQHELASQLSFFFCVFSFFLGSQPRSESCTSCALFCKYVFFGHFTCFFIYVCFFLFFVFFHSSCHMNSMQTLLVWKHTHETTSRLSHLARSLSPLQPRGGAVVCSKALLRYIGI